jgi:hypothetical protein
LWVINGGSPLHAWSGATQPISPKLRRQNLTITGVPSRDNAKLVCAGCKVEIDLESEQFRAAIDQIDKTMKDMRRRFREIGKKD